jgi:hypothetical protein
MTILAYVILIAIVTLIILMFVHLYRGDKRKIKDELDVDNYPYITVPTKLYLYKDDSNKSKKYFDDELLNDLYNEGNEKEKMMTKLVNTTTLIHVDRIVRLSEWTTSRFDDEKVLSDCTLIVLDNGDEIFASLNINLVEAMIAHKYGY